MKRFLILSLALALFFVFGCSKNEITPPVSSSETSSENVSSEEILPIPDAHLSSSTVFQGDMITVFANNLINPEITTTLDFAPQFFLDGDKMTALLPISYKTKAGDYEIKVTAEDFEKTFTLTVEKFDFDIQNMYIDQTIADETVNSSEADWELYVAMKPVKALSDDVKYYTEDFISPLSGNITTEYGMIRYVNDEETSSRHSGIDIAAAQGTLILATNSGRVILSQYLQMTGNTVVIEHGFGLKSVYYHMSELCVSVDDMVNRGDVIGKVGSTGFSTGPHLHFSMAVNTVWVNPWLFFPDERVANE